MTPRLLLATALATIAAAPLAARAERLTLDEAVLAAGAEAPDARAAAAGVDAAEARVEGARAQLRPRVHLDGNVMLWSEPLANAFSPGMPPITFREQVTAAVSATLAQPLSGLVVLRDYLRVEQAGARVARHELDRTRVDAAARAAQAYLRVLEARAFLEIAEKSVAQVEAQLARARVLVKGGLLADVDVLRIEAARDAVKQQVLEARAGVAVARRALALAIDRPDAAGAELVDDLPDPPPPLPWGADEIGRAAVAGRPDVAAADARVEQARLGARVQKALLFPDVRAVAVAQHTEGNGPFSPEDSFFVGVTLSWDVWDWGRTWQGHKEARARAAQARIAAEATRAAVGFEDERSALEAQAAWESVALARSALAAAEEAYRIQSVRFENGAATTTDVLEAETEVARARTAYATARYDYYLAAIDVLRSVGRVPSVEALARPTR